MNYAQWKNKQRIADIVSCVIEDAANRQLTALSVLESDRVRAMYGRKLSLARQALIGRK